MICMVRDTSDQYWDWWIGGKLLLHSFCVRKICYYVPKSRQSVV